MSDTAVFPDSVKLGLGLAWHLDLPLTIVGREVRVPPEIGKACWSPATDAPDESAPTERIMSDIELSRRIAWIISEAAREIEELGLDLALLTPAPRPAQEFFARRLSAPDELPPDTTIREVRGEFWIGNPARPPVAIVRADDGRPESRSWLVVSGWRNTTVAWHPTKYAALVDAVERVKSGALRTPGDGSLVYRPPQDEEE